MESEIIKTALDLLTPVLESSIIVAGAYVKLCGRSTITGEDTQYGMKYAARNVVGKHVGTMFPELQDSDSDDEDSIEESSVRVSEASSEKSSVRVSVAQIDDSSEQSDESRAYNDTNEGEGNG